MNKAHCVQFRFCYRFSWWWNSLWDSHGNSPRNRLLKLMLGTEDCGWLTVRKDSPAVSLEFLETCAAFLDAVCRILDTESQIERFQTCLISESCSTDTHSRTLTSLSVLLDIHFCYYFISLLHVWWSVFQNFQEWYTCGPGPGFHVVLPFKSHHATFWNSAPPNPRSNTTLLIHQQGRSLVRI